MIFIILVLFLEIIVASLLIYLIIKADKWVLKQLSYVCLTESDITYQIRIFRNKLKEFNKKSQNKTSEPLSPEEFGFIFGKLFSEIIKSSTGFGQKMIFINSMLNMWKYKNKLKTTIELIIKKIIGEN